jgi:hypothetical protein
MKPHRSKLYQNGLKLVLAVLLAAFLMVTYTFGERCYTLDVAAHDEVSFAFAALRCFSCAPKSTKSCPSCITELQHPGSK